MISVRATAIKLVREASAGKSSAAHQLQRQITPSHASNNAHRDARAQALFFVAFCSYSGRKRHRKDREHGAGVLRELNLKSKSLSSMPRILPVVETARAREKLLLQREKCRKMAGKC